MTKEQKEIRIKELKAEYCKLSTTPKRMQECYEEIKQLREVSACVLRNAHFGQCMFIKTKTTRILGDCEGIL